MIFKIELGKTEEGEGSSFILELFDFYKANASPSYVYGNFKVTDLEYAVKAKKSFVLCFRGDHFLNFSTSADGDLNMKFIKLTELISEFDEEFAARFLALQAELQAEMDIEDREDEKNEVPGLYDFEFDPALLQTAAEATWELLSKTTTAVYSK